MQKTLIAVLSILLSITCLNASARSNERTGVSTGTMIMGGKLFFAAIEREMYNECQEQSADMWDMEPQDREYHYKCVQVFKDYRDNQGLKLYQKAEALAKKSYSKLRRALIAERVAVGGSSEPPNGCDGHHIVPKNDGRPFAKKYLQPLRDILNKCNIDIDSADNGVFLPNGRLDRDKTECEGVLHPKMHNEDYYIKINDSIKQANDVGGCDEVKSTLRNIKEKLINNTL